MKGSSTQSYSAFQQHLDLTHIREPNRMEPSESPSQKLAYSFEEAAVLLSLSRAHLYRLIDMGELKSIQIGRLRRITRGQLESFLVKKEGAS